MAAELVAMLALCPAGDEIVFVLGHFMECEKRRQTRLHLDCNSQNRNGRPR